MTFSILFCPLICSCQELRFLQIFDSTLNIFVALIPFLKHFEDSLKVIRNAVNITYNLNITNRGGLARVGGGPPSAARARERHFERVSKK